MLIGPGMCVICFWVSGLSPVWPPVSSSSSESSPVLKVRSTSRRLRDSNSFPALLGVDPSSFDVVVCTTAPLPSAVSLPPGAGCPASGLLASPPLRPLIGVFRAGDTVALDRCDLLVAGGGVPTGLDEEDCTCFSAGPLRAHLELAEDDRACFFARPTCLLGFDAHSVFPVLADVDDPRFFGVSLRVYGLASIFFRCRFLYMHSVWATFYPPRRWRRHTIAITGGLPYRSRVKGVE